MLLSSSFLATPVAPYAENGFVFCTTVLAACLPDVACQMSVAICRAGCLQGAELSVVRASCGLQAVHLGGCFANCMVVSAYPACVRALLREQAAVLSVLRCFGDFVFVTVQAYFQTCACF
jgi:hypothetical protein